MKTIKLGEQGLSVTQIGLGCMGMSEFYGSGDDNESLKVLDRALELGCNFWDTADMYGPWTNEELISHALEGRRDKITLATKFGIVRDNEQGFYNFNGHPDYVRKSADASLKRLRTDYIDLYYQHRVDPDVPIEDTVGAMAELVEAGKVKYIGLSEATPDIIERAHKVHPISALQTEYSLWSRDVEEEILPTVRKLGIGFVAYSPLGRGFLTGAIASRDDFEEGDWRLSNPRFQEEALAANKKIVDGVKKMADEKGVTPAQLALAWVISQGDDIAAIPGTKRMHYLAQNVASADINFSEEEQQALSALGAIETVGARY